MPNTFKYRKLQHPNIVHKGHQPKHETQHKKHKKRHQNMKFSTAWKERGQRWGNETIPKSPKSKIQHRLRLGEGALDRIGDKKGTVEYCISDCKQRKSKSFSVSIYLVII